MILITRPKIESLKLKTKLRAIGFESHIDSLSQFTVKKKNLSISKLHIVMITSPRVADIVLKSNKISKTIPLLIIGSSSLNKLRQSGFKNIIHTAQDSDKMIIFIKRNFRKIFIDKNLKGIDYLTGSISNNVFIKNIKSLGVNIKKKIIYETNFKKRLHPLTIKLIKSKKIKICLLYSQENTKHFLKLIDQEKMQGQCSKISFLCLSPKISKIIKQAAFKNVRNAKHPNQQSLIKELQRHILL